MSMHVQTLPVIALRGLTAMPGQIFDLEIGRDDSICALKRAHETDQRVFMITQIRPDEEYQKKEDFYTHGVVGEITYFETHRHAKSLHVKVEGIGIAKMLDLKKEEDVPLADVQLIEADPSEDSADAGRMRRALKEMIELYASTTKKVPGDGLGAVKRARSLNEVMTLAVSLTPMDYQLRQSILDAPDRAARFDIICLFLEKGIEDMKLLEELRDKVKQRMDKAQRDYLLREQLKVIQEELGEQLPASEAEEFTEKLNELNCSEDIRAKIAKQIQRYRSLQGNSSEASVVRGYIETLLAMPWDKASVDNEDLRHASDVLEKDHYGLEKVKERVLEYLAVRALTKKGDSPILCLAGPPGTGKTSVARSIARALDRKYVRIGLGGVHDEAEIRGHRRTYVGAMPGRIANGLRQAGVKNPLILLDEVDKLTTSMSGDPAAALLEALDSEQNSHFTDHYIDMPVDLSDVLFVATANDLGTIPTPLLDRLEIIEVTSYTDNEKFHIAKEHLLPKMREHNGLKKSQLSISNKALQEIISGWTREAGVRQLERNIGQICRKSALRILKEGEDKVRVKVGDIPEFLGRRKADAFPKNPKDEVALVRGLAWTSVGGVTLEVEVNILPGKGDVKLTGQLGDVMKESAAAAMSCVRMIAGHTDISADFFTTHDFHIHIPQGAVPKDGPSAGITMATAIFSAASGVAVRADTAMTGEITLRGRVLAIGGLKEKLLAANKAGMSQVIVPRANQPDVEELSEEIIGNMKIRYASSLKDVLGYALVDEKYFEHTKAKEGERSV